MINATFFEGKHGELRGFLVRGHAGYAPAGEDIVCAGVSALVQTAAVGLRCFLSVEPLVDDRTKSLNDVFVKLILPENLTREDKRTAQVILETMELGIQGIAGSYGKYLEVRRCCKNEKF
ncbi:MAG TPA: ribosomal-processing cysteine protease Prp [Syntrophomonadaceae bacterium]|nr:ribosomal-processing cysteine protease Prp [Syntrophomonadaceae bacterium]